MRLVTGWYPATGYCCSAFEMHDLGCNREALPEVPLTHFRNAANSTKPEGQFFSEWWPYQALSPLDAYQASQRV